jgi:hypothetical protein
MSDSPAPVEARALPDVTAEQGAIPESKMERAVAAILFGISLLEESESGSAKAQGPITKTKIRKSVAHLQTLLTPSIYQNGKHYKFSFKQQRLMFYLGESGDFRKAAALANMGDDEAARFLASPKFREFFQERIEEAAVRHGWTADHFISELNEVWVGRKAATREQMDAIKEIGARVAPKIERVQHEFDMADFEFVTK